jgi:hypothetical protein
MATKRKTIATACSEPPTLLALACRHGLPPGTWDASGQLALLLLRATAINYKTAWYHWNAIEDEAERRYEAAHPRAEPPPELEPEPGEAVRLEVLVLEPPPAPHPPAYMEF